MEYEYFLNNCEDQSLRKKIWEIFRYSEKEAKWFGDISNNWIAIRSVIHDSREGGAWSPSGAIKINAKWDDPGAIMHEVFHSAFHNSPLYNYGKLNKWWGDAFCDVFRYNMEKSVLGSNTKFCNKLNSYALTDIQEIFERLFDDRHWQIQYAIPASRIIKKTNGDYDKFKELWKYLNLENLLDLEDYFKYSLTTYAKKYNIVVP